MDIHRFFAFRTLCAFITIWYFWIANDAREKNIIRRLW